MTESVISVEDLHLSYTRKKPVLDGVDLSVPAGSLYALLGSNGVGKSSLVRACLGIEPFEKGRIELFGEDVWRHRAKLMRRVGYVPESSNIPEHLTISQAIDYRANLVPGFDREMALDRVRSLDIPLKNRPSELSRGQSKQVGLTLAIAATPDLLIMDDPTLGLDPGSRRALIEELVELLADRPATIFMTTHDLELVEKMADHIAILHEGKITLEDSLDSIRERFRIIVPPPGTEPDWPGAVVETFGGAKQLGIVDYEPELARARLPEQTEVRPMSVEEIYFAATEGRHS